MYGCPLCGQPLPDPRIIARLSRIETLLTHLVKQGVTTMADLSNLTAQVAQNTSVEQSAVTLIQGLAQQIQQAGTDPVKLQALQDQLAQSASDLAQAVAANTPSGPSAFSQASQNQGKPKGI